LMPEKYTPNAVAQFFFDLSYPVFKIKTNCYD
jgi:hypothetical protein